jgi:hypothetical protein
MKKDATASKLLHKIKQSLKHDDKQSFFIFSQGKLISLGIINNKSDVKIGSIYEFQKDNNDGFLYIQYDNSETF